MQCCQVGSTASSCHRFVYFLAWHFTKWSHCLKMFKIPYINQFKSSRSIFLEFFLLPTVEFCNIFHSSIFIRQAAHGELWAKNASSTHLLIVKNARTRRNPSQRANGHRPSAKSKGSASPRRLRHRILAATVNSEHVWTLSTNVDLMLIWSQSYLIWKFVGTKPIKVINKVWVP